MSDKNTHVCTREHTYVYTCETHMCTSEHTYVYVLNTYMCTREHTHTYARPEHAHHTHTHTRACLSNNKHAHAYTWNTYVCMFGKHISVHLRHTFVFTWNPTCAYLEQACVFTCNTGADLDHTNMFNQNKLLC